MLTIIFEIAPLAKIFLKNAYFLEIFNENLPLFTFLVENTFARRRILDRQKILVKKNQIFVKKTLSFLKIQKTTKNFHGCEKSRTASLHHL